MIPTSFNESNCVLDKPDGMTYDDCQALSVWRGRTIDGVPVVISNWKLTRDELAEINETGRVWLTILGETMPPAAVEVKSPFIVD